MSALAAEEDTSTQNANAIAAVVHVSLGKKQHSIPIQDVENETGANIKESLKQMHYPHLQCKYMRLLFRGKELKDMDKIATVLPKKKKKVGTVVKCKLLFQQIFHTELSESQKEMATREKSNADTVASTKMITTGQENNAKDDDQGNLPDTNTVHFVETQKDGPSVHVTIIHKKKRHKFCVSPKTTVLKVSSALGLLIGVDARRFQFLAKGKKVPKGSVFSELSKQGGKVVMRLLFDEKFHIQKEGQTVLENVLSQLEDTEKQVNSMYAKLAHNFFDHAVISLKGQSYDEELKALERTLTIIDVQASDEAKRRTALARLKIVQEKNEKINGILKNKH